MMGCFKFIVFDGLMHLLGFLHCMIRFHFGDVFNVLTKDIISVCGYRLKF
jgi:hypothetical protein